MGTPLSLVQIAVGDAAKKKGILLEELGTQEEEPGVGLPARPDWGGLVHMLILTFIHR